MIDFNEIKVFVTVAEAGSFIGAGKILAMPSTSVSRKVQQLENNLGVRLLHRSTRKLSLTTQGEEYFKQCRHHLAAIDEANRFISTSQQAPQGTLRITSPLDFASHYVQPWVIDFLASYPDIKVEMEVSDAQVDLIEDRIDIAFRTGKLQDSNLIARRLGPKKTVCCASPRYLAQHGIPALPQDLTKHWCIPLGGNLQNQSWTFQDGKQSQTIPINGRYSSDSVLLAIKAAVEGLGIVRVPVPLAKPYLESNSLVSVLETYEHAAGDIFIIYQSHKYLTKSIRLFIDHILEKVQPNAPWDD
ncbi:LysR family transcriptional regulator [Photobacterium sp. OFAV2-7]|uniref:LysR family transcriptional regulator n=1 Tax=Photobacterium sp. OFAV2-7 TaxID=2917748 RepID=UPI001EF40B0B|nr:LysR family transcriptional regulator [Photobacterium sp. OFAV2-7]MCG7587042.1 LysR substrate-binding domain-containing protein [Photobacterium sp. OFAV2-7]